MVNIRLLLITTFLSVCFQYSSAQSWKTFADSAKVMNEKKNKDSAILLYQKARWILSKDSALSETYIKVCYNIGEIYFSMNTRYDSALYFYAEAKSIIDKLPVKTNALFALVYSSLGKTYYFLNQYKNAELSFIESKNIYAAGVPMDSLGYVSSSVFLANVYSETGAFEKAETIYKETMQIREKKLGNNHPDYAQSCNNLADLYRKTGQYEKAEPLALKAKEIRGQKLATEKEKRAYAISCTNLANLYRDIGQYEKAEQLYIEAKQIRAQLYTKESTNYADACNILADLYVITSRFEMAEPLYLEALQIREKKLGIESRDYAQTKNNMADMYVSMEQYEKAIPFAENAKNIWAKTLEKDDPAIAINNNLLGAMYNAIGKHTVAEGYFLEARSILKNKFGEAHPLYFSNSTGLARIYWNTNKTRKANELYAATFDAQYKQLNKVFQFMNENEKQLFLENINGSADEFLSFYFSKIAHSNATEPYHISLLSRNLVLSAIRQQREAIYQSGDSVLNNLYEEWIKVKQQLAYMNTQSNETWENKIKSKENWTTQLKELENMADNLEKILVRRSASFNQTTEIISYKNIQNALPKSGASIEFISFQYYNGKRKTDSIYYAALLIRKDKTAPQLVSLFEKKQYDRLMNEQMNTGIFAGKKGINTSRSLYALIWKPLEKYLAGINTIYFSPAGELYKIPFSALYMNAKQVLSDKYKLVQLNSTATIPNQQENIISKSDLIQLYGGILYDADSATLLKEVAAYKKKSGSTRSIPADLTRGSGFTYLPGTADEIKEVSNNAEKAGFHVNSLSGVQATEESFKNFTVNASPAVLHIATHGFFFTDPKYDQRDLIQKKLETGGKAFKQAKDPLFRSGLLFAGANNTWKGKQINGIDDGILTAYEVSNMYLPHTKLVVLSACKTALGDIRGSEGVFGLQRAFKMAGVQNLIMSLWQVPDAETAEFMQLFYKFLFSGKSISTAFYEARKLMKNKYRNDPNAWAAWVLIK